MVAVAGERMIPIPDGVCEWRVTTETRHGFWEWCGDETAGLGKGFVEAVGTILLAPFFILFMAPGARFA